MYSFAAFLASYLLIFGTYKDMNSKGKVICAAFGISGAFVFGGQFGFVSGIAPEMLGAFIVSKLTVGFISIVLSLWFYEHEVKEFKLKETGGNCNDIETCSHKMKSNGSIITIPMFLQNLLHI